MFLTIITDYVNECWKMRNEAIHGETTKEGRTVRKKRLVEQVKSLYRKKSELNGSPISTYICNESKSENKNGHPVTDIVGG